MAHAEINTTHPGVAQNIPSRCYPDRRNAMASHCRVDSSTRCISAMCAKLRNVASYCEHNPPPPQTHFPHCSQDHLYVLKIHEDLRLQAMCLSASMDTFKTTAQLYQSVALPYPLYKSTTSSLHIWQPKRNKRTSTVCSHPFTPCAFTVRYTLFMALCYT